MYVIWKDSCLDEKTTHMLKGYRKLPHRLTLQESLDVRKTASANIHCYARSHVSDTHLLFLPGMHKFPRTVDISQIRVFTSTSVYAHERTLSFAGCMITTRMT